MSTFAEPLPSPASIGDRMTSPLTTEAMPSPTQTALSEVRASDAERADTVALLHHALGEGRLDLDETDVRVTAAYAAQYRNELPPLLADLPGSPGASPAARTGAPTWSDIWSAAVWRARIALFGGDFGAEPPTAGQHRVAAALLASAVVWMAMWAVIGAATAGP